MSYVRLAALAVFILLSACGGDTETPTQPGAPIITNLTADPETVAPGETSTITWTVAGDNPALRIETEGRPITVTGETSYVAQPTVTMKYILVTENAAGRAQDEVTVNVTPAPPETP